MLIRAAVKFVLHSGFTYNWMATTDLAMWMWSFKNLLPDIVTPIFWDNSCCIIVHTFRIQFNGCIKNIYKYIFNEGQQNQPDFSGLVF